MTRKVVRDDPDENMGRGDRVRDGFGTTSPEPGMVPVGLFGACISRNYLLLVLESGLSSPTRLVALPRPLAGG